MKMFMLCQSICLTALLVAGAVSAKKDTTTVTAPTTAVSNTTHGESTSESATTTPAPDYGPDVNTYTFNHTKDVTCLKVQMAVNFTYNGDVINVTKSAKVNVNDSCCGFLRVDFGEDHRYYFSLNFTKGDKDYYLSSISVGFDGEEEAKNNSLKFGDTYLKDSYVCDKGFNYTLTNNVTIAATRVKFQAFEMDEGNKFGTAKNCDTDLSPIIPIVVGAVLAFLVLLVIIAYLIGRRRSRSGYEEI